MPATPVPVQPSFWSELFTASARANRERWWLTVLLTVGVYLAATLLRLVLVALDPVRTISLLPVMLLPGIVVFIGCSVVHILASVRRLHDLDKSGHWLWLFYAVPLLFGGTSLLLSFHVAESPGALVCIIVDAFLMPGWIRTHNNVLAAQLGA
jgi:uncharacterized membrane protein YhaH (DUF805 family)